jgi:hypothetical protein
VLSSWRSFTIQSLFTVRDRLTFELFAVNRRRNASTVWTFSANHVSRRSINFHLAALLGLLIRRLTLGGKLICRLGLNLLHSSACQSIKLRWIFVLFGCSTDRPISKLLLQTPYGPYIRPGSTTVRTISPYAFIRQSDLLTLIQLTCLAISSTSMRVQCEVFILIAHVHVLDSNIINLWRPIIAASFGCHALRSLFIFAIHCWN